MASDSVLCQACSCNIIIGRNTGDVVYNQGDRVCKRCVDQSIASIAQGGDASPVMIYYDAKHRRFDLQRRKKKKRLQKMLIVQQQQMLMMILS